MRTYSLTHERSFFVEPDQSNYNGFTESGIFIERKDFKLLPSWKTLARVLQVHPTCRDVRVNDLIVHRRHAPLKIHGVEGAFHVMFESQVLGIVRRADGSSWFIAT